MALPEDVSPVETPPIDAAPPSAPTPLKRNVLMPAIVIFIVVLLAVGAILLFAPKNPPTKKFTQTLVAPVNSPRGVQRALNERGVFGKEKVMAKVGAETIYGNDLNYTLLTTFYDQITKKTLSLDALKELALRKVAQDSITLQMAKKKNLIELTQNIFNNPNKNYQLRQQTLSEAVKKLEGDQETISGETLSIWFQNLDAPQIPLDDAEQLAKTKMDQLRADIVSGKLTFEQAKAQIQNDTTLAKLDKNYKGNAYYSFENRNPSEGFFSSSGLDNVLLTLKEGEISPVLRSPKDLSNPSGEKFYYIMRLTKRENPQNGSFVQALDKEKEQYPIQVL